MRDCGGELLGRVRSGLASDQEKTAFEAHVGSCESCRMTLDIMADFDAVGEAEPGDWEQVARMGARVVGSLGRPTHKPVRITPGPWLFLVAALAFAGVAVAGGAFLWAPSKAVEKQPPPLADSVRSRTTEAKTQAAESVRTTDSKSEALTAREPAATAPPAEATVVKPQATAADIYRAANDARREGKSTQAIFGYQRLQRDYPSSAEARASRVSLGGLLLRSGSPSSALQQFDAYLASDGGQLAAEALFGRAQALRALGRSVDEVQNLRRLVANYPDSAYATHAKRRLQELH